MIETVIDGDLFGFDDRKNTPITPQHGSAKGDEIMKAYRLTSGGGVDGIIQIDLDTPEPGPDEIRVGVRATSLNYRDLGIARRGEDTVIPLSDGAGEITAIGSGVTQLSVGDRVAGCFFSNWQDGELTPERQQSALGGAVDGMLAQEVVLPADGVVPVPPYMTYEEAATLPCAAVTAWQAMFEKAQLRPGQSILLLGTGGVSIVGLQLAKIAGVRAIITSSSNEKLSRARDLGADDTINYTEREDWDQAVLDLTGGRGVDLVLEVGGEDTLGKSMTSTRIGGNVVLIGRLTTIAGETPPWQTEVRRINLSGVYVGSRTMFDDMNRALELHEVHPVIDRVFDFDDALGAYHYLESQAHLGKVVISV